MRGSYCYMPIVPARFGAFRALASLSPMASSRTAPMFDIPNVVLKPNETIDRYLNKRADAIFNAWAASGPCYVDAYSLPLEWRTTSGELPLLSVVSSLRGRGATVVPVTGSPTDRGLDYVRSIRSICRAEGACIRIARDELWEPRLLRESVRETIGVLGLDASQIDVVLDFRYVGKDNFDHLKGAAFDALRIVTSLGNFRNVSIAASSVPDALTKKDQGKIRREPRRDFELWTALLELWREGYPMPLCDYGIVGAHYVQPGRPVTTPARIRYTTQGEHIFLRGNRDEHSKICQQLLDLREDFAGSTYSAGDQRISESANGRLGPGNAALWIGYDASHHFEFVSHQAWEVVASHGLADLFALSEPTSRPWLQPELFEL